MGAYSFGPFENDDASDWLSQLWDSQGGAFLQRSLVLSFVDHVYLQAPKGSIFIAASEIVAEGCGVGSGNLPRQAKNWVLRNAKLPYQQIQPSALRALKRVLAGRSELHQLWGEDRELYAQWQQSVLSLKQRLSGSRT
jgi:hypothetical protein